MVLPVESHQFIVGLEREAVMPAVHDQIVVLGEGNGSAVCLVERDGIMLAEILLQEFLGDFVSRKSFLLISCFRHCIYIQATLGFVDCSVDTIQHRTAARAMDVKGVCGTAVLGAEPEIVRNHLLKSYIALHPNCCGIGWGYHSLLSVAFLYLPV